MGHYWFQYLDKVDTISNSSAPVLLFCKDMADEICACSVAEGHSPCTQEVSFCSPLMF